MGRKCPHKTRKPSLQQPAHTRHGYVVHCESVLQMFPFGKTDPRSTFVGRTTCFSNKCTARKHTRVCCHSVLKRHDKSGSCRRRHRQSQLKHNPSCRLDKEPCVSRARAPSGSSGKPFIYAALHRPHTND